MRRYLWPGLGVVLVLGAVVLFATSGGAPTDVGWVAYTPLDGGVRFPGDVVLLTRGEVVASTVGVLGLLVLAAWLGHRAGVRRGSRRP